MTKIQCPHCKEYFEEPLPTEGDKQKYIHFSEIITYLNQKTGKDFKSSTAKTRGFISARLKEGFKVEDFKKVIDNRCKAWGKNPEKILFLRPETLFGTKFEGYLNDCKVEKKKWEDNKPIPALAPKVAKIVEAKIVPYDKKAEACTNPKKAECKSPYCKATCRFGGINLVGEAEK